MKVCTDIPQSIELAKYLPRVSADLWYSHYGHPGYNSVIAYNGEQWFLCQLRNSLHDIPCWSLAALLDVLPDKVVIDGHRWSLSMNKKSISYLGHMTYDGQLQISVESDNSVDSCYEMILKLKEMNLL